jgi:hypothetical protein
MGFETLSIQFLIEIPFITKRDWARYRIRADIFDVFKSSLSKSSRQK